MSPIKLVIADDHALFCGGETVGTLRRVRRKNPMTRVWVLTAFSGELNIVDVAKGGARGYALKGVGR